MALAVGGENGVRNIISASASTAFCMEPRLLPSLAKQSHAKLAECSIH